MPFKIKYKFEGDEEYFEVYVTYKQYKQFKKLPIVSECEVMTDDDQNLDDYKNEMQEALNYAAENDTSHIKKLSHPAPK